MGICQCLEVIILDKQELMRSMQTLKLEKIQYYLCNVNFSFCINSAAQIQIAPQVQPRMECAPVGCVHVEQPAQYVPEQPQLVIRPLPKLLRLSLAQQMLVVMYVTIFFISLTLFCSLV